MLNFDAKVTKLFAKFLLQAIIYKEFKFKPPLFLSPY